MKTAAEIEAEKKAAADEAARKAALKAKSKDDETDDEESDDDENDPGDNLGFTKEQKAYVESLRKQSASYRTKAKELESGLTKTNERLSKFEGGLKKLFGGDDGENLTPEQRIEKLEKKQQREAQELEEGQQQLALANALKDAAIEHGVKKDDYEYFEYLVGKRLATLEDGEELSDEEVATLAKKAKAKSAARSTSVDGGEPDPDEDDGQLSVEEFMQLGISARSQLYQKDKAQYEKLVAAEKIAKKKK